MGGNRWGRLRLSTWGKQNLKVEASRGHLTSITSQFPPSRPALFLSQRVCCCLLALRLFLALFVRSPPETRWIKDVIPGASLWARALSHPAGRLWGKFIDYDLLMRVFHPTGLSSERELLHVCSAHIHVDNYTFGAVGLWVIGSETYVWVLMKI